MMQSFVDDLKYHFRSLMRRWPFTLPIVLCLALGVGANSTVFSVVNAVLLRPLPYEDPDRLVAMLDMLDGEDYSISPNNLIEWRRRSGSFASLEAMETKFFNVTGGEAPVRVPGGAISAGFFDLLGVRAAQGRSFSLEEDVPGGPKVAMVSDGLYRRQFGADPNILDRQLHLNGESYAIVGVLPPGAESFLPRRFAVAGIDVWIPLALDTHKPAKASSHYLYVVGRLAEGIDLTEAQAEMDVISGQLAEEFPVTNEGWSVLLLTVREHWVGDTGAKLLLLFGAVAFVLLIACANVGNLLINRAVEQQGDMALRMAFGANRWNLLRHSLAESALLGLIGGVVGLGLAVLTMRSLVLFLPANLNKVLTNLEVDARVLVFTFMIALLASTIPGLVAAWKISSRDLAGQFSELGHRASAGVQRKLLRNSLVVVEIALTLVLLIGAALMIQSFGHLNQSQIGFEPQDKLTFSVSLSSARDAETTIDFYRQISENVRHLPGVSSAGVTSVLPIRRFPVTTAFRIEDRAPDQEGDVISSNFRRVDPEYFETLGMMPTAGRSFQASDDLESLPVAILSEELAERYWPDGNAVGRRILRGRDITKATALTIVGIVPEIQDEAMGKTLGSRGTLYVPYTQGARPTMYWVVDSPLEPAALVPSLRQAVLDIDSSQPIADIETMEERIAVSVSDHRFATFMLLVFSGLSLVLALVGLFSLLSYSVSQRIQEMGMRMALGATSRDIVKLVLGQTMVLTLIGLGVGLLLASFLNRFLASMLFEIRAADPRTYMVAFAVLLLTCAAAGFSPAWRASRCNPSEAIRME